MEKTEIKTNESVIEVEALTKSFDEVHVLKGINL